MPRPKIRNDVVEAIENIFFEIARRPGSEPTGKEVHAAYMHQIGGRKIAIEKGLNVSVRKVQDILTPIRKRVKSKKAPTDTPWSVVHGLKQAHPEAKRILMDCQLVSLIQFDRGMTDLEAEWVERLAPLYSHGANDSLHDRWKVLWAARMYAARAKQAVLLERNLSTHDMDFALLTRPWESRPRRRLQIAAEQAGMTGPRVIIPEDLVAEHGEVLFEETAHASVWINALWDGDDPSEEFIRLIESNGYTFYEYLVWAKALQKEARWKVLTESAKKRLAIQLAELVAREDFVEIDMLFEEVET